MFDHRTPERAYKRTLRIRNMMRRENKELISRLEAIKAEKTQFKEEMEDLMARYEEKRNVNIQYKEEIDKIDKNYEILTNKQNQLSTFISKLSKMPTKCVESAGTDQLQSRIISMRRNIIINEKRLEKLRKTQPSPFLHGSNPNSTELSKPKYIYHYLKPKLKISNLDSFNILQSDTFSVEKNDEIDVKTPIIDADDKTQKALNKINKLFIKGIAVVNDAYKLQLEINEAQNEIVKLDSSITEAKESRRKCLARGHRIDFLQHTLHRKQISIQQLDDASARLNRELAQQTAKLADLEHGTGALRAEAAKLRLRPPPDVPFLYSELKRCKEQFARKTKQLNETNRAISEAKVEISQLEKNGRKRTLERLSDDIDALRLVRADLEIRLNSLEITNQSAAKAEAAATIKRNKDAEERVNALVFASGKIRTHIKTLNKTIAHLRANIQSIGLTVPKYGK